MSLHTKLIPFLVAGFCTIALGVWGFSTHDIAASGTTASSATVPVISSGADSAIDSDIPMLPVVYVTAKAPIPVLPRVVVRADGAERAAAMRPNAKLEPWMVANSDGANVGKIEAPRARLGMPYYSFGKVLPRISKE